ncbi:CapA family protein [Streptomyces sp. NA04227]|uniref:CapA family protein n=1 Tax=Streptomyces sp. NA04227 TaxID=2742136 RepID=UPI0020CA78F6|nr:CapA family protein [Streptomyces sp. NA04227]
MKAEESTRDFTLVATGDLLVHDAVIRQAATDAGGSGYDFRPMLAAAKPLVSTADVAICHMETVYGANGGPYTGYPLFKTPPQIARGARALGYDSCSTASNHTMDAGAEGVTRTLGAMDAAHLKHAGSARSAREQSTPTLLRAGGATLAHLAYTYDTNGIPVPADRPWMVNLLEPDRILADARAARRAGADVVVVSVHWGTEWQQAPDEQQVDLARQLTESRSQGRRDIDLILGTHNHVPQAFEKVNGTWVVYGLGDQIAGRMNDPRGQLGTAARFTFRPPRQPGKAWTVKKAEALPYRMDNDPLRLVDLNKAVAAHPDRPDYVDARDAIRQAVLSRGAQEAGLVMD